MAKICSVEDCNVGVFSKGLCQRHWKSKHGKPLPRSSAPIYRSKKSINKVSDSKKQQDKIYNKLRPIFLEEHSECELKLEGCVFEAIEVHHLFSGASRSKYYLVVSTWKSACRNCHHIVHNVLSKDEAIALGLKLIE